MDEYTTRSSFYRIAIERMERNQTGLDRISDSKREFPFSKESLPPPSLKGEISFFLQIQYLKMVTLVIHVCTINLDRVFLAIR